MSYSIILRGVPGSGKSTAIKAIKAIFNNISVHSTDSYFMIDGEYRFDPSKIVENHTKNYESFVEAHKTTNVVVCDNTNIKKWEFQKYKIGTTIEILFQPSDLDTHMKRNTHNVPKEVLQAMINSIEEDDKFDSKLFIENNLNEEEVYNKILNFFKS